MKSDGKEAGDYLYYELLDLVKNESYKNLEQLDSDLNDLINNNRNGKKDWNSLISWPVNYFDIIDVEYKNISTLRQDCIPNGLKSDYTENDVIPYASSSFNSRNFYDFNVYLPQLVLLSRTVNDKFQKSVSKVFNIDATSKTGFLKNNEIIYTDGPVKTYERAKQKAENDYCNETFPKSACILDLIRCSLVFNNISTLLNGLDLLIKKINYFQSGNIIGIVRIKNGFTQYSNKNRQYCDIKLNVLIKGKKNNIIGEIQFLLSPMLKFKKRQHSLYSIERQKTFIDESLSRILPQLLNKDKQLFVSGNLGNVSKLCQTIVLNNMSIQDIVQIDKISKESILTNICCLNNVKAIKFLMCIIPHDLLINRLCTPNRYNILPMEYAVKHNQTNVLNEIFLMDKMISKYQRNIDLLFRLIYCVRHRNMFEFLIKKLNLSKEKFVQLLDHQYSHILNEIVNNSGDSVDRYVNTSLITNIGLKTYASVDVLKVLVSIIGDEQFVKHVFIPGFANKTIIESAVRRNKNKMIKYIFSFDNVCNVYKTDPYWIHRLLFWLKRNKNDCKDTFEYIVSKLELTKESVKKLLQGYKYKEKFQITNPRSVMCQLIFEKNIFFLLY